MISREEVLTYVKEKYDVKPDYPWIRTPNSAILRHQKNRKWFAAIINVTEDKLGLSGNKLVDVLNLKCEPLFIGSLTSESDVFPAYHMNKEHWISVLLNSSIPKKKVCELIDLSYELTR